MNRRNEAAERLPVNGFNSHLGKVSMLLHKSKARREFCHSTQQLSLFYIRNDIYEKYILHYLSSSGIEGAIIALTLICDSEPLRSQIIVIGDSVDVSNLILYIAFSGDVLKKCHISI